MLVYYIIQHVTYLHIATHPPTPTCGWEACMHLRAGQVLGCEDVLAVDPVVIQRAGAAQVVGHTHHATGGGGAPHMGPQRHQQQQQRCPRLQWLALLSMSR